MDDMWTVIEAFGIKRQVLEIRSKLSDEEVKHLYETIKKAKKEREIRYPQRISNSE